MKQHSAARRQTKHAAQFAGHRRRPRRDLLASTALHASAVILLAFPAMAQPAPNARPQGGAVVAGQASISQAPTRTTVTQTSQRAAIDWRSYDIGSNQTVAYQQPNAGAIVLNRVIGPNPSQIAGRITANGQVVIVNGSGVVFHAGSQVDAQSLVVSAPGVTNANFMAGRLVFDQPAQPGAKISNAGSITVAQTGLAALVGPQVANSGVITAKMGHVVLAGAEAHTVDLYGDGLMSVDVTRDVRTAPNGATALVTNTGTIMADGGTILLTAKAADGIMQNLVTSRGKLQANTVGDHAGTIVMSAVGGTITVEGAVHGDGKAPGAVGGTVVLAATDTVAVGSEARITANGGGGGGTIAVGTTAARARLQGGGVPAGSARTVTVAAGARISADGRGVGSGGTVALLSTDKTTVAGRITARGGRRGGDGGQVEISGQNGLQISGTVDTSAPQGKTGLLTIDPATLTIGDTIPLDSPLNPLPDNSGLPPAVVAQNISAATFNAFQSNVSLQATGTIILQGATTLGTTKPGLSVSLRTDGVLAVNVGLTQSGPVTLQGATINVNAPITVGANTLTLNGGLVTQALGGTVTAGTLAGTLTGGLGLNGASNAIGTVGTLTANGNLNINNGANPLAFSGALNIGTGTLNVVAGSVSQAPLGTNVITAGTLTGTVAGATSLLGVNAISNVGAYSSGGDFGLTSNVTPLTLTGALNAGTHVVSLNAGSIAQTGAGVITAGEFMGASAGAVNLTTATNAVTSLGPFTGGGAFALTTGTALNVAGGLAAGANTVTLNAASLSESGAGLITAGTLAGTVGGATTLNASNVVANLGPFTSGGDFAFTSNTPTLTLTGALNAGAHGVNISTIGLTQTAAGAITAGTLTGSAAGATLTLAANAINNLGQFNSGGPFALTNAGALNLSGALTATAVTLNAASLTQAPGSVITANTLVGTVTGAASLTGANAVSNLGAFTAGGDFALTSTAAPLTLTGALNAGAHTVTLTAPSLAQSAAGIITAGTLRGTTTGAANLSTANNAVANLGQFTSGGAFSLNEAGTLNLTGAVNAGTNSVTLNAAGLTQTAGSAITAGALTGTVTGAASLIGANAVVNLGAFTTGGDFALTNTVALALAGSLNAGAHTVTLKGTSLTQTAGGAITAGMLTGSTTGSAALDGASNAVSVLGAFTTGAGFALDNRAVPLAVNGAVAGGTGAVALRSGTLTINGAAGARLSGTQVGLAFDTLGAGSTLAGVISLPATGTLAIAPSTPEPLTIGASGAGLVLTAAQIAALLPGTSVGTVQLGSTAVAPAAGGTINATATDVTIAAPLTVAGTTQLALYGTGSITELPGGSITAATVTAGATGDVRLDAASAAGTAFYNTAYSNAIGALGAITAGAGRQISVASNTSLQANGAVSAPGGAVTLTSLGTLALNGAVGTGAGAGTVVLQAVTGLTQTAAITTGELGGAVGDAGATLTGRNATLTAGNAVSLLGNFTAKQGDLQFTDAQALTVAADATVSARNVTLSTTGAGSTLLVNGAVGACAIDALTAGTVTLNASGALTITGIVGGERAVTLGGASNTVQSGVLNSGRSGATPLNGTITVTHGLTVAGGDVLANAVNVTGGLTQSGGLLLGALTADSYAFSGGQVYASQPITLSSSGIAAGSVVSGRGVTINGTSASFDSAGTVLSTADILFALPGSFTQSAGQIAAKGSLTVAGAGGAGTPVTGLITQAPGASLAAGAQLTLFAQGAGAASLAGTLASPTVQVAEPQAALSFAPAGLTGSVPATASTYTITYHCPGCDTLTPGAVFTPGANTVITTGAVRLDGVTISLDTGFSVPSLELHSQGATTQTAAFTAGTLLGTAGYTATLGAGLPTYDAPAGAGALTLTLPGDMVSALGPYYVGGAIALRDGAALDVVDRVVAGGGTLIALTGPALTVDAGAGSLGLGSVTGGAFTTNTRPVTPGAGTFVPSTVMATDTAYGQIQLVTDRLELQGTGIKVDARGGTVSITTLTPGLAMSVDAVRNDSPTVLSIVGPELARITTLGTAADVGLGGPRTLRLGSQDGTLAQAPGQLTITGALSASDAAATVALYSAGGISETPGGSIAVGRAGQTGTVTGVAPGTVSLTGPNHFDVLGPFTAGAGFAITDTPNANAGRAGLTVLGTVSSGAGDLALTSVGAVLGGSRLGGTIAIGAAATASGLNATGHILTLTAQDGPGSAAAITETAVSTILAATLQGGATTADGGAGYGVQLGAASNAVGTLGQFGALQGALVLNTVVPPSLTVAGLVAAQAVQITAQAISVTGDVGGGAVTLSGTVGGIAVTGGTVGGQSSVTLQAPGGVSVSGGTVESPTVVIGSGLALSGTGQVFGTSVTVTGGTTMTGGLLHAVSLAAGTVAYSGGDLFSGNDLTIATPTALSGTVSTRGNLTLSGLSFTSSANLTAAGTISFTVATDFHQTAGTIAAGAGVSVTAGGLAIQDAGGAIESGGTVAIRAAGAGAAAVQGRLAAAQVQVTEPAADLVLTPAFLGGSTAVAVSPLANVFHAPGLDSAVASSTFTAMATVGAAPMSVLRADGRSIAVGAVTADRVELHSSGDTNGTGVITAGVLTGTAGYAATGTDAAGLPTYSPAAGTGGAGAASYTATNVVLRLGDYQASSGLSLNDAPGAPGLTIAGIVQAGTTGSPAPLTLTLSGAQANLIVGDAAAPASVLAGSIVTLTAPGAISEAAGSTLAATRLSGSAGSVALPGANQVGSLGAFSSPGGFSLNDGGSALVLTGPLNAGASAVNLTAGSLAQTAAGVITAGTLSVSTTGTADLSTAMNAVAALGALTSAGPFAFNDGGAALTLTGPLNVGANTLTLTAGSLTQTAAGVITAGTLSGSTVGAATLTSATNAIGAIAGFTSGGDFALNDGATGLALTGPLNAAGRTVTLNAGSLSQTGAGVLTAAVLTGRTAGAADLTGAANAVGALGAFTSGGAFGLNDGGTALTVTGPVNAGANTVTLTAGSLAQTAAGVITAGTLAGSAVLGADLTTATNAIGALGGFASGGVFRLNDGATGLVITGPLNAGGSVVFLTAGSLAQTVAGIVTAGTLAGSTAGSTDLTAAANAVGALGGFSTGGPFGLSDGGTSLAITGPLNAGANTVTLNAGSLAQGAGGVITAGTLTGSTAGSTDLTTAANLIGRLGAFTTGGSFGLNDGGLGLTLTGPLNAGGNTVTLAAGSLSQTAGGVITAGTLTGSTGGAAALTAANAVTRLGAFTTGGAFTLTNGPDLQVTGPVQAGVNPPAPGGPVLSLINSGNIALAGGTLAASTVALQSLGVVSEPAGSIIADTLTVAAGQLSAGSAQNQVNTLGTSTVGGGLLLVDGRFLTVSGPVQGGDITLSSNGMTIPGAVSSGGMTALDAGPGPMTLTGPVQAGRALTMASGDVVTLAATAMAPLVTVTAPTVQLQGGTIVVGGVPQPKGATAPSLPMATTAASGAFFEAGSQFSQTTTTTVTTLPGYGQSTVRVDLTSGSGLMTFAGLSASSSNVILDVNGGSATGGRLVVQNLTVIYTGSGFGPGMVDLNAQIGVQQGTAAAGAATIFPAPARNYRINACAVASVNCIVLQPQSVPVGNPLKELSLNFFRQQDDDSELLVPNITDQGL